MVTTEDRGDSFRGPKVSQKAPGFNEFKRGRANGSSANGLEVTRSDIAAANRIAQWALGRSIDELPGPTRRLLGQLFDWTRTESKQHRVSPSEFTFTRRQAREALRWNATHFREHLERLVQAEYVVPHGRGKGKLHRYSLLYGGCEQDGRQALLGLVEADALIDPKPDTTTATWHQSKPLGTHLKEFTNMATVPPQQPCAIKPFGKPDDPSGFYHLLRQHISWLAVRNFSPSTLKKRTTYVRAFALWCIARDVQSPMHITKPMIEAFQRHLFRYRKPNGKPLAWSSQHLHLKEVRQFFVWLTRQNIIALNPAAELDLPKVPRSLPKAVLTHAEVERVLQQPDTTTPLGLRDRAMLETLYSAGIRRAEVCALRIDHIHVDRQVLYIHRGKGQKDRYVPIGIRALTWIARYVDQARGKLCVDPNEQTLFLTVEGRPLQPDSLTEYASRYIKQSGVNKSGACHIFRHSMATAMHDGGADIRTIQAILGHERLDTTQIYTRVGLKKLLETHARTHPAERRDEDQLP